MLNHCNSNKSPTETLIDPERVSAWAAAHHLPGCSSGQHRPEHRGPPIILHSCSSYTRGVRKPREPQVRPTLTSPPHHHHAFCVYVWSLRIKRQCKRLLKRVLKSSLPFSYSEYWCTWWAGYRHERMAFAITALCGGGLTGIQNSQERANLHLTGQTLPYHLGSVDLPQIVDSALHSRKSGTGRSISHWHLEAEGHNSDLWWISPANLC